MSRLIATIICFAGALAIGMFLVWPEYQELRQLKQKVEIKEEELQSRTDYFAHLKDLQAELKKYPESLDKVEKALPQSISLPSLFNFFQKTASENGLVLQETKVGKITTLAEEKKKESTGGEEVSISPAEKRIKKHMFDLAVVGSYKSFKNFLSAAEDSARIIEVKSFSFSFPQEKEKESEESREGQEPSSQIPFSLTLSIHSY